MTYYLIYAIGFGVCWIMSTIEEHFNPYHEDGLASFISKIAVCFIWPLMIWQVAGVAISLVLIRFSGR